MAFTDYRILGPLEVIREGERVPIGARKERTLLLCLLLHGNRVVSVDRLVDALWRERPAASAGKLLQHYVSNLRRKLGAAAITTAPPGYCAPLPADALDAERFEQLLREGREAREDGNPQLAKSLFDRALALWRGQALADAVDEPFAASEAARLEELRLECVEERLAAQLEAGEAAETLGALAALCGEHPQRERLHGLHMVALYQAGRQVEALEVFAETRRELLDKLGLEPGDDLRALERAILRQDSTLAPPTRSEGMRAFPLPTAITPLVGRERELQALRELMQRPDARLLTLVGAGGSGKTRLALALASDCHRLFANGAAFVDLSALREAQLVPATIAQALGVGEQAGESIESTLADWATGKELLLVVDNFEQVIPAAPQLLALLESAPRIMLVVTSRRVLHVSGEHVVPVQPLDEDEAAKLFVARAQSLDPECPVSVDDPVVRAICRRLDGLPLALELAASRIRTLTPSQLLERLDTRLTLLTGGPLDLPARQQTLRDTLDWSAALLSDNERRLFAGLSLFAGGCSLEAATEVAGADLDGLGSLVDHSLLRRDADAAEPRFLMLETVREYGLELLGSDRENAESKHTSYFLELAERADLCGATQRHWLASLERDHDNFRAALDHAARLRDQETELRLTGALWRFWWLRGYLAEGRARLEEALARAPEAHPRLRAGAYCGAAGIAWNQGDHSRAHELARLGLQAAEACGEGAIELACHTVLGLIARDAGDYEQARNHLERSGAIAKQLGRERDEMVAQMNLGSVAFDSGDHATAVPLWEHVLAYHRAHGSEEGQAIALLNLGLAAHRLGGTDHARTHFSAAEVLFEGMGFREHLGHALQGLAAVAAAEGHGEEAARLLGRASRLLAQTGSATIVFDSRLPREAEASARAQLGDEQFDALFWER